MEVDKEKQKNFKNKIISSNDVFKELNEFADYL